ncbi:response regulator [Acidaminobacter sp. JC074]|uniref:response regulator n=1 Tax=Acidaminobacter sp. JC074 TaxID=2530199 RepID=UPI00216C2B60|nr:response regulator [Acidaminobacter sp. JC074]
MARILIVDDSIIMRRNLTAILKEAGHTIVSEASNGTQAYLQYRIHKPDIVTMDITMPNMDGLEALEHILEEDPDARVIMISALDQKSKVYTALRNGAKHYIIKPLTADKITTVIDSVMSKEVSKKEVIEKPQGDKKAFEIENDEGAFIVTFNENLSFDKTVSMVYAVQGFLYLDNPSIVFDFDRYEIQDEESLTKFVGLLNKIRSSNGTFSIKLKNPTFITRLTNKDNRLNKRFETNVFILE